MIGILIAMRGLKRAALNKDYRTCCACKSIGPTCCLPCLGGRRFCKDCAAKIMRGKT